jgi:hypothetical protein
MSGGSHFFECEVAVSTGVDEAETQAKLLTVLEIMRPKASPFDFLRIGGSGDGAYLVPNDLENVEVCFSPGVSNRKSFEDQLTNDYGIRCHMCDFSSDEAKFATPLVSGKQTFDKLWLEPKNGDNAIDLESWIIKHGAMGCNKMILQMDIEGAEYRNILAADIDVLKLFRIIIVEVHGLSMLNSKEVLHGVISPFFDKIARAFTCVHIHPNNYSKVVFVGDKKIDISDAVELTFLRTDAYQGCPLGDLHAVLVPHPLDTTNGKDLPPIVLSEFWCGGSRRLESRLKIVGDDLSYESVKLNH